MKFKGFGTETWLVVVLVAIVAFVYLYSGAPKPTTPDRTSPSTVATPQPTALATATNVPAGAYEFTTFSVIDGALSVYSEPVAVSCGDGVCSASETCGACEADCGCTEDEFCSGSGLCKPEEICGDGVCSNTERLRKTCAFDCGCSSSEVLDYASGSCVLKASISDAKAQQVAEAYLKKNDQKSVVLRVDDGTYKGDGIKEVLADCRAYTGYYCYRRIIVDSAGKILEVASTK